ncbi:integrase core domain-containing protein [Streptomyces sp. NPDC051956]|uniref:integrase core domain-containing protein n=1 Tax=Streptomyces sp. NPDC051956 TaxID=3365677 RepID=UPI0037CEA01B
MDLADTNATITCLIRDRDAKYPALFDETMSDVGIRAVLTGVRIPRMNAIIERWVQTCRHELLDHTLIWNEHHLRHALRQFELHYNLHRPHPAMHQATPLPAVPEPLTPAQISHLDVRRKDRLGGVLHEYQHACPARKYDSGSGLQLLHAGQLASMAPGMILRCRCRSSPRWSGI